MPYNPGVQDISGQLRAQGMMRQSSQISQGVSDAFREYRANEEKRRLASATVNGALATDTALMADLMKDTDAAKVLKKRQAGKSTASDEMYLAGLVGSRNRAMQERQQAQVREMEMKQSQAQIGHIAQQNEMLTANLAKMKEDKIKADRERAALLGVYAPKASGGGQDLGVDGGVIPDAQTERKNRLQSYIESGGTDPARMQEFRLSDDAEAKANNPRPGASIQYIKDDRRDGKMLRVTTQPTGAISVDDADQDPNRSFEDHMAKIVTLEKAYPNPKTRPPAVTREIELREAALRSGNALDEVTAKMLNARFLADEAARNGKKPGARVSPDN